MSKALEAQGAWEITKIKKEKFGLVHDRFDQKSGLWASVFRWRVKVSVCKTQLSLCLSLLQLCQLVSAALGKDDKAFKH